MVKLNIELVGNEEDVLSFVALCAKIQVLGQYGASRTIPVDIDGDGSARLYFNIKTKIKDKDEEVDLIDVWMEKRLKSFKEEVDNEIETHYIGE